MPSSPQQREQVIGSNVAYETRMTDAGPVLLRKSGLVEPICDGRGKPVNIDLHIGRTPTLSAVRGWQVISMQEDFVEVFTLT